MYVSYVCVCVYECVYVWIYMYVCMYGFADMHECMCTCKYNYITYMIICIYIYTHLHVHANTHTYICIHLLISRCVYVLCIMYVPVLFMHYTYTSMYMQWMHALMQSYHIYAYTPLLSRNLKVQHMYLWFVYMCVYKHVYLQWMHALTQSHTLLLFIKCSYVQNTKTKIMTHTCMLCILSIK